MAQLEHLGATGRLFETHWYVLLVRQAMQGDQKLCNPHTTQIPIAPKAIHLKPLLQQVRQATAKTHTETRYEQRLARPYEGPTAWSHLRQ